VGAPDQVRYVEVVGHDHSPDQSTISSDRPMTSKALRTMSVGRARSSRRRWPCESFWGCAPGCTSTTQPVARQLLPAQRRYRKRLCARVAHPIPFVTVGDCLGRQAVVSHMRREPRRRRPKNGRPTCSPRQLPRFRSSGRHCGRRARKPAHLHVCHCGGMTATTLATPHPSRLN
jgi:hypothetical protein